MLVNNGDSSKNVLKLRLCATEDVFVLRNKEDWGRRNKTCWRNSWIRGIHALRNRVGHYQICPRRPGHGGMNTSRMMADEDLKKELFSLPLLPKARFT